MLQTIENIIGILSFIYTVFSGGKALFDRNYNNNMNFRYKFNRKRPFIGNKHVTFKISTRFNYKGTNIVNEFNKYLSQQYNHSYRMIADNDDGCTYVIKNSIILKLLYYPTVEDPKVNHIYIEENVHDPLKIGIQILHDYGHIIEELCKNLHISSKNNDLCHGFDILYSNKKKNPFINNNTRLLLHNNVTDFNCTLRCYDLFHERKERSDKQIVDIGLKDISVSEYDFYDIERVAPMLLHL